MADKMGPATAPPRYAQFGRMTLTGKTAFQDSATQQSQFHPWFEFLWLGYAKHQAER